MRKCRNEKSMLDIGIKLADILLGKSDKGF